MDNQEKKVRPHCLGFRPWTRHSMVLFVAGIVYIGLGVTYASEILSPERERSLIIALNLMPITAWGAAFILAGLCALASTRWPLASEKWGYIALTGLSSAWGAAYLFGVLLGLTPVQNISAALTWGMTGFLWYGISGLVNPPQNIVVVTRGRR